MKRRPKSIHSADPSVGVGGRTVAAAGCMLALACGDTSTNGNDPVNAAVPPVGVAQGGADQLGVAGSPSVAPVVGSGGSGGSPPAAPTETPSNTGGTPSSSASASMAGTANAATEPAAGGSSPKGEEEPPETPPGMGGSQSSPPSEVDPDLLFEDAFTDGLSPSWTIRREVQEGHRVREGRLELLSRPGAIYQNGAGGPNVFVQPLADFEPRRAGKTLAVQVRLDFTPQREIEQAGIALLLDEDNYVLLVKELFNGPSLIVVDERLAKPNILAKRRFEGAVVDLRLTQDSNSIVALYRETADGMWQMLAETNTLAATEVSLMAQAGPNNGERWAAFDDFQIRVLP